MALTRVSNVLLSISVAVLQEIFISAVMGPLRTLSVSAEISWEAPVNLKLLPASKVLHTGCRMDSPGEIINSISPDPLESY